MKKNFVIFFLFLFVASIMGGMTLQNVFSFSTVVGYGAGVVFLSIAITLAIRNTSYSNMEKAHEYELMYKEKLQNITNEPLREWIEEELNDLTEDQVQQLRLMWEILKLKEQDEENKNKKTD